MRDELLWYYERELGYLRRLGAEYARRYPKVAGRLQLEPTKCEDPHVERLLEGFAFLAARIHLKLDDDLPEVAESMLALLAPSLVRPVPSLSVAEFVADAECGVPPAGFHVPRGAPLHTRPVGKVHCAFQTAYDVRLWPLAVHDARWVAPEALEPPVRAGEALGALRLQLRTLGAVPLADVGVDALRCYLHADGGLAATLYELLCNACTAVFVRPLAALPGATGPVSGGVGAPIRVELPPGAIRPVGFGDDERLLPGGPVALAPHALLQEYFVLPEKYRFVDLAVGGAMREGARRATAAGWAPVGVEIVCLVGAFDRPERRIALSTGVTTDTVRLGCTPVANLFTVDAEPILLTHRRAEYPLVADARRRLTTEVYAVDLVRGVPLGGGEPMRFEPLYGLGHAPADGAAPVYWVARRQRAPERGAGATDVSLAFVDRDARTVHPSYDAVTARVTCFNGDLPARLPIGEARGDFHSPGGGPVARIAALVRPTEPVHPPLGGTLLWRLVSQLSLNHLSLTDGPEALRELLRLQNLGGSPDAERQIQGVLDVRSAPAHARVPVHGAHGVAGLVIARGRRVDVELDEDHFAGDGAFLFASVLERFLALHASLNSFTQLAARTRQRRRPLRVWAPRAGRRVLA